MQQLPWQHGRPMELEPTFEMFGLQGGGCAGGVPSSPHACPGPHCTLKLVNPPKKSPLTKLQFFFSPRMLLEKKMSIFYFF